MPQEPAKPASKAAETFNVFWQESARKLLASAKLLSSLVEHGGSIGSSREFLVRECLKSYVPTRFRVATGFVINEKGQSSKQQDVIVFDSHTHAPLFSEGDLVVVPAQSVVSCIEVKSTLNAEKLKESILNGLSVRAIAPHVFTNILAFESTLSLRSIAGHCGDFLIEHFKQIEDRGSPKPCPALTSITVLDRGPIKWPSNTPQPERRGRSREFDFLVPKIEHANALGDFLCGLHSEIASYIKNPAAPLLEEGPMGLFFPRTTFKDYDMLCYSYFFNAWGWCEVEYDDETQTANFESPFQGESADKWPIPKGMTVQKFIQRCDKATQDKLRTIYKDQLQ